MAKLQRRRVVVDTLDYNFDFRYEREMMFCEHVKVVSIHVVSSNYDTSGGAKREEYVVFYKEDEEPTGAIKKRIVVINAKHYNYDYRYDQEMSFFDDKDVISVELINRKESGESIREEYIIFYSEQGTSAYEEGKRDV